MIDAAKNGRTGNVCELLDEGADVDSKDEVLEHVFCTYSSTYLPLFSINMDACRCCCASLRLRAIPVFLLSHASRHRVSTVAWSVRMAAMSK